MWARVSRVLFFGLVLWSCSSPPPSHHLFTPTIDSAHDGRLHYALPRGWFHAGQDAGEKLIWLVRNDYRVSLTVSEVHIDSLSRREISRLGLVQLCHLTMSLTLDELGALVASPPVPSILKGRPSCGYQYSVPGSNDMFSVILLDTGASVYEVTVFISGSASSESDKILMLRDAFVDRLRW